MCKISVIIPVYNAENTIEKCVASILTQSIDALELILVDDGSTDASPAIIDRYAREYKNVVAVHQPNSKQGAARNAGMDIAKGKYILFVDSDDYLRGDVLNDMYEAANSHDLDMLASSFICINEKGEEFEAAPLICNDDVLTSGMEYIQNFGYKAQPTVFAYLYLRTFLNGSQLRFLERTYSEDCLFTLQCVTKARRIFQRKYAHYVYLYNESSTTRRANPQLCFDNINIGLKIIEYLQVISNVNDIANTVVMSHLLKYASFVSHVSLTLAAEQNLPASEILRGETRKKLLSALKYDRKYYPAMLFIYLRLENVYQWMFLKKLIKLKRKLLPR